MDESIRINKHKCVYVRVDNILLCHQWDMYTGRGKQHPYNANTKALTNERVMFGWTIWIRGYLVTRSDVTCHGWTSNDVTDQQLIDRFLDAIRFLVPVPVPCSCALIS